MRKSAMFFFCMVCLMLGMTIGCKDKKPEVVTDSLSNDTVEKADTVDTVTIDTIPEDAMDSLISATPMPVTADELFDDFLFNFTANKKLQYERVMFPLQVIDGDSVTTIERNDWNHERYFMKQEFYTLIFDDESQLELAKDTRLDSIVIEKINLQSKSVEQHVFRRINGQWMLSEIVLNNTYQSPNRSFLDFYEKFASDSLFQIQSMNEPVSTVLPDPDDDYSTIEGEFYPEQWPDFKPLDFPSDMIYNILYGQQYRKSRQKLFVLRGISNGLEAEMTFKQIDGRWKLVKLIN
jgi:hypothetical protein